jgi:MoaA/NifB/PqqE/SkfB family radical SAM enzyme
VACQTVAHARMRLVWQVLMRALYKYTCNSQREGGFGLATRFQAALPNMFDLAVGPLLGKPVMVYYYVTYKCNARCVFCNIPDGPMDIIPSSQYTSTEGVIEHLKILKALGVRLVDFTGGEPLLRKDIGMLLRAAKEMGFRTQMTTNCTLYPRRAQELHGLFDILNFSLCSPEAEPHNTIRRDNSYEAVMQSIDIARELGEPYQIIFVLTNENSHFLPAMIELARQKHFVLKIQPEWEYFGNDGVNYEYVRLARQLAKEKNVYLNLAEVEIFARGNEKQRPRCKAANAALAISPDGYLLYPCYHKVAQRIKFDWNIIEFFKTPKWKTMQAKVGTFSFCDGCRNLCYLHPSFYYRIDRLFVLSALADIRYLQERRRIERERAQYLTQQPVSR